MRSQALKFSLIAAIIMMVSNAHAGTWGEHESKLATLRQRVKDGEAEVKHLIEAKRHAHDEAEVKTLVEQIATSHKSLTEFAKKLDAEELHVRFKHPEHAEKADVKYTRRNLKSLEQLESEVGIDARL
ncbi:MAG TPA: hypothetical protein VM432_01615, partial [Bdellovibrionales bacterium]|nr:hypothetical protein [Bdellovibrionales bacterium]